MQEIMITNKIIRLFKQKGLGTVLPPITPVSGGFLHRMYRVNTADCSYAVKHLNPEIMKRPTAMENFRRAEALEAELERAGIPAVAGLLIDGSKMQSLDGAYFYVFPWHNGKITDWYSITAAQCRMAGSIQGRIHAIAPKIIPISPPQLSAINWTEYIAETAAQNSEMEALLRENEALLGYAQEQMNRAREALPGIECITDEDMDPKNVMWDGDNPAVIDLECLEYGNPVSSALQLSLQWAGVMICDLDFEKLEAFFNGYLEAYDNGFRAYDKVFGLAYTWIEWLDYNVQRALNQNLDEAERELGRSEVRHTLARIRYLHDMEDQILQHLRIR